MIARSRLMYVLSCLIRKNITTNPDCGYSDLVSNGHVSGGFAGQ